MTYVSIIPDLVKKCSNKKLVLLKRYKLLGPIVEKTVERQKDRKHFEETMKNKIFDDFKHKHEIMQYLGGRRKTRKIKPNKKRKKQK